MPETKTELVVYDHSVNLKQAEFHDLVMLAVAKQNPFRYFFYGGAIRGGKTFVCLYIFWQLAKLFPGSRWHVFREDNPALESTAIPSMEKLIGTKGDDFVWRRKAGNFHVAFSNGSKIFFKSENLAGDTELKEFLGLETNGVILEQMEALSEKLLDRIMERIGSWIIKPMPVPLILGTFNPTQAWVKKRLWDKFQRGELAAPYYLMTALPEHNKTVTAEQWQNWSNLDPENYLTMIKGLWIFKAQGNLFAYSFSREKHVVDISPPGPYAKPEALAQWEANVKYMEIDPRLPVYISFDFNVDPMTCLVAQKNGMYWMKIIKEYRLPNSSIYDLLDQIKTELGQYYLVASGDASGRSRNAGNKAKASYVDTIKAELELTPNQVKFLKSNPSVANTRIVLNSVLHKHPEFKISSACMFTIDDLETIKTDGLGGILNKQKEEKLGKTHLLDNCFDGETIIETDKGEIELKNIRIGDKVLTSKGFKQVYNKWHSIGEVYEYEFSNGIKIRCTKDHLFKTSFGWMMIDTLYLNKIPAWPKQRLYIGEETTSYIPQANILKPDQKMSSLKDCTNRYGMIISARFQKVMRSIIRTKMFQIMIFQTLFLLRKGIIANCTCKKELLRIQKNSKSLQKLVKNMQRFGMGVKQEKSGIVNRGKNLALVHLFRKRKDVFVAESNIWHKTNNPYFVPMDVSQNIDGYREQITKRESVNIAKQNLSQTNTLQLKPALLNAQPYCVKKTKIGTQKVYDISVKDEPEFFANGLLVHNCRYLTWNYLRAFVNLFS